MIKVFFGFSPTGSSPPLPCCARLMGPIYSTMSGPAGPPASQVTGSSPLSSCSARLMGLIYSTMAGPAGSPASQVNVNVSILNLSNF